MLVKIINKAKDVLPLPVLSILSITLYGILCTSPELFILLVTILGFLGMIGLSVYAVCSTAVYCMFNLNSSV